MPAAATVRLRPWQSAALAALLASSDSSFLAVAAPGAGKTSFALAALRAELARQPARIVVVAPTAHLKTQWARAAAAFGLHLDPAWAPADGAFPRDMHGVVTTYQQVAAAPSAVRVLAEGAYAVLDEVHHAGDEQAWGQALAEAFGAAHRRLLLSGTPFRSDTRAIPFVRYVDDEAEADYSYGYAEALADGGILRPVYFPRVGGEMEWTAPDGALQAASFDDPLTAALANQRLRTALSLEGEWLPTVLREAIERLRQVRRHHPEAGGLAIATDQEHARGIASLLRWRFGVEAETVTSDDPSASARIATFGAGRGDWLVAVRMVSEGVDLPRLRVGVYATTTTTELFFRQAVGRLVRWTRGVRDQRAWLFIPDDERLRVYANGIAEQRRHSLRREARPDGEPPRPEARTSETWSVEQLSLFAPLSAVATVPASAPWDEPLPEGFGGLDVDPTVEVELAPPPPLGEVATGATRREQKDELRLANADAARDIARRSGLTHAQVNAELNRRAGLRRITEASAEALAARLRHAERWLKQLSPGLPPGGRGALSDG